MNAGHVVSAGMCVTGVVNSSKLIRARSEQVKKKLQKAELKFTDSRNLLALDWHIVANGTYNGRYL